MQKIKIQALIIAALLVPFLLITSCGTNLFEGLVDQPEEKNVTKLLENAKTVEDYQKALEIIDEVLADPNLSNDAKQEAYYQKGKATLGANGVSALEMFADFGKLADSANNGDEPSANIFNLIQFEDANLAEIALAADSLNTANAFANMVVLSDPALSPSLDANEQLLRGIANSLVVLMIAQDVYNIDADGEITPNIGFENPADQLEGLMNPLINGTTIHSITYYGVQALDGFEAAGVFKEDQLAEIKKIRDVGDKINELYTAWQNANASYQINGAVGPQYPTYDLTTNTGVEDALAAIFQSVTN